MDPIEYLLTYLSSSSPVGHKATTMLRHKVLSFAEAWASPQDSPISFSSAITDCHHVIPLNMYPQMGQYFMMKVDIL